MDDDVPYLLLTPGPLTTSRTVKQVMLRDYCTWDDDYNGIVQDIRRRLVALATSDDDYTSVLMQGSGTFSVEATLGTAVAAGGKALVVNNGAYGARMAAICRRLGIAVDELKLPETEAVTAAGVAARLSADSSITHVAVVHCETTTGLLNPVEEIGAAVAAKRRVYIVDAMSSFGGIPLDAAKLSADFLVSSANKCIQGVPGFGFVIARRQALAECEGRARSLSLDLFDQWREMEQKGGKWRYTSPTHVVRAFAQALNELEEEGGPSKRHQRYCENHRLLVEGLESLGYAPLIAPEHRSPIITSFLYPAAAQFSFDQLYHELKRRRFVIYPGKVSQAETFRVGVIGHVFPDDVRELVRCFGEASQALGLPAPEATT